MARKRRHKKASGSRAALIFFLTLIVAGAFFYIYAIQRAQGGNLLPAAQTISEAGKTAASAIGDQARTLRTAATSALECIGTRVRAAGRTVAGNTQAATRAQSAADGGTAANNTQSATRTRSSADYDTAAKSVQPVAHQQAAAATSTTAATPPAHPSQSASAVAPHTPSSQNATPSAPAFVVLPAGLELPRCAGHEDAFDHELREFSDYALCYRESYEVAEWSAYCLEKSELTKNASRTNDFRPDPLISTGSASLADYRKSGYDRGHLAPAADFAYSAKAMSETFYMSNMTPQAPAFNRGIWQHLEAQVRAWAAEYGRAYVVTGPVLDAPASGYASIGSNAVAVPRAFYKIVLVPLYADVADAATPDDAADVAVFAFIIPNEKCDGSYFDYACTVDNVEARTGIDFFYQLDEATETRIEAARFLPAQ